MRKWPIQAVHKSLFDISYNSSPICVSWKQKRTVLRAKPAFRLLFSNLVIGFNIVIMFCSFNSPSQIIVRIGEKHYKFNEIAKIGTFSFSLKFSVWRGKISFSGR